jgi:hypothetical protein
MGTVSAVNIWVGNMGWNKVNDDLTIVGKFLMLTGIFKRECLCEEQRAWRLGVALVDILDNDNESRMFHFATRHGIIQSEYNLYSANG